MTNDGNPKLHLRFGVLSLAVTLVLATAFVFVAREFVRSSNESAAAEASRSLVAQPLGSALLDGDAAPTAGAVRLRADALVPPLVAGEVRGVRIWTTSGSRVYSSGGDNGAGYRPDGVSLRSPTSDGGSILATYTAAGDFVIEVDRDGDAISGTTADLQNRLIIVTALAALLAFALVQGAFRLGIGRFEREHKRLLDLYAKSRQMRSSLELHEVLSHVARDLARIAGAQYALVTLFDAKTGDLTLRTTYDATTDAIIQHRRGIEEWFFRRCVATNTIVVTAQAFGEFGQFFGADVEGAGTANVLCVPMSVSDRVIGALALVRTGQANRRYTPSEITMVQELLAPAAGAIEQALRFTEVRWRADQLELSYDTTLKVLMAALDTKDDATEGHCERVAKLTVELARQMNVPDGALLDMERGALLHDVGKIGVPDAVLNKPDELNEREWEAMRKHPLLAGLMVGKVSFLEGAMPILMHHHERYDGNGYPFGLTAEKIPVEARIFAVVDSYDAMTSNRPYRDAMSHADAIDEIGANSGTQFDPVVVEAFAQLMDARHDLRARQTQPISSGHVEHDLGVGENEAA